MTGWFGRSGIAWVKFDAPSIVILWFELFMFAIVYALAFRSWLIFGIIFLGSAVLMYVPKRTVYLIFALSFLWGFIAFSIGHSLSWGWALGLGLGFFLLGIGAHSTGLKKLVPSRNISSICENNMWQRNGYPGQNFN